MTAALLGGVVPDGALSAIADTSAKSNEMLGASSVPPISPERSGSPPSLVSWGSLGMQGRSFVSGGPTLRQLRDFGGASAREPIRVYVGLKSASTISDAANLAVRELERTGAFGRSILGVITTTGTGWIDPYIASALEYMHNGDTALLGMQYSFMPSWVLSLTDRDLVERAGRELFTQVYDRWSKLPPANRPRLFAIGESLGSLGSEGAFTGLDDVRARTAGALWAGPTAANGLWSHLVANRDPGSTAVFPVYKRGETVRFASVLFVWPPSRPGQQSHRLPAGRRNVPRR